METAFQIRDQVMTLERLQGDPKPSRHGQRQQQFDRVGATLAGGPGLNEGAPRLAFETWD
ncbi:MAG TPA: hypothetical protein VFN53_12385 [Acidobacteriaceae bacterium]|nr:hypothetical protein [Acidobacteriaceae bacterium]